MDRELYNAYYARLPLAPGQMRLLGVQQARSWDDPVVCVIGIVDISESPPYNAVSYTWGGQVPEHPISCNGYDLLVTQSCIDALKGVRFQDLSVVWIDQLCINQFDMDERNSQVLMMHEIYSKAKTIYISLGNWESTLAEESKCFIEGLEVDEKSGKIRRSFSYPVPQEGGGVKDLKITGPVSAVHASVAVATELLKELAAYVFSGTHWDRLHPLGAVPTAWKIVAAILSNIYWRRKWVVQEIALGADIQVMVSQFTMRFEHVLGAYIMVNRMVHPAVDAKQDERQFRDNAAPHMDLLNDMAKQQTSCLLTIGQAIMALQDRDLSKILLRLARPSTLETSWDIDSVYAVRALMKDFGDLPPVQYKQDHRATFVEYSRWFVEHGFGAEILVARTYDGISLGLYERPTWSINWSSKHMTITNETLSYNYDYYQGKRSSRTETIRMDELTAASENVSLHSPDANKLQVIGSVLDTVVRAIPQPKGCKNAITFEQACDFIAQARAQRSGDANSWVTEYLASSERREPPKLASMKDHRGLLELLEDIVEDGDGQGGESDDAGTATTATSVARRMFELKDSMMHHFTLFTTKAGWSAFGPDHIELGDVLITVSGLPTVFVVREDKEADGQYILIGQAEVIAHAEDHGLAMAMARNEQQFIIG